MRASRYRFGVPITGAALVALACQEVHPVLWSTDVSGGGSGSRGGSTSAAGNGAGDGGSGSDSIPRGGEPSTEPNPPNRELGFRLDAGDSHTCAARFGTLSCWGANGSGQLGTGDKLDRLEPTRVGADGDWVMPAAGVEHTCALKSDGSVWCFGSNRFGQLGHRDLVEASSPVQVPLPGPAEQLSSGFEHACVILVGGALYCWGRNAEGNLGLSDAYPGADRFEPVRVGEDSDFRFVATGQGHTMAIRGEGRLWGWGRNSASNLGLGSTEPIQARTPTSVGSAHDWTAVAAGQDGGCATRGVGLLFCWGGNLNGELGVGDKEQRLAPTAVGTSQAWGAVDLNTFHGCAVNDANTLYCWGRNLEGQLATGDNDERLEPTAVLEGVVAVALGRFHSCAGTADYRAFCAGAADNGQLGLGDDVRRNVFGEVPLP